VLLAVPRSLSGPIAIALPAAGVHECAETQAGDPARFAGQQITKLAGQVDTALIGPGLMDEEGARALAHAVLEGADGPAFVIDAMSLTGLWNAHSILARHSGKLVITPHAGEMASLTGLSKEEVCADPRRIAQHTAQHLGCIVVLKGANTYIAQPDGTVFLHEGGVVGLATAGSGDVMAGLLAGLLARGASALDASLWSVYLHAQAGRVLSERMGALGFLARELLGEIPPLMHSFKRPP
jgi:hydroxyethylthiazole kinase-like uncharacterized protein yjeF